MIHYALRCSRRHDFDGWFRDSKAFEAQAADGRLECPVCADRMVERALMTPRVAKRRVAPSPAATDAASVAVPSGEATAPSEAMPDGVRSALQRLRAEVERNCDYVGGAFADTVRAMHRGEAATRGVYGETSPEQAEALRDEGIKVASIPWVKRADA